MTGLVGWLRMGGRAVFWQLVLSAGVIVASVVGWAIEEVLR